MRGPRAQWAFGSAASALLILLLASLADGQNYKEKVMVDYSYYTMHLYKHDADGSYATHHVDMSGASVHDFLSNHSQGSFPFRIKESKKNPQKCFLVRQKRLFPWSEFASI